MELFAHISDSSWAQTYTKTQLFNKENTIYFYYFRALLVLEHVAEKSVSIWLHPLFQSVCPSVLKQSLKTFLRL